MNTLSKDITSKFFSNTDGYQKLIELWSKLMNDPERRKELEARHHLLYLIFRGKDWRKAFVYATNPNKAKQPSGLAIAWRCIKRVDITGFLLIQFSDLISDAGLAEMQACLSWKADLGGDAYLATVDEVDTEATDAVG